MSNNALCGFFPIAFDSEKVAGAAIECRLLLKGLCKLEKNNVSAPPDVRWNVSTGGRGKNDPIICIATTAIARGCRLNHPLKLAVATWFAISLNQRESAQARVQVFEAGAKGCRIGAKHERHFCSFINKVLYQ